MRHKTRGTLLVFLILGAGGWLMLRSWMPPEPDKSVIRRLPGHRQDPPAVPSPASLGEIPAFGTDAFKQMALERGAAWLSGRNRDATGLLAMWDVSGEEAILREAAEKFPDNPQVCLAMLNHLMDSAAAPAERKLWTDRLIASAPDNPLGYHYLALLQSQTGDVPGVMAALDMALSKSGRLDNYEREHMMAAKEGLLASGVPLKDSYYLSMSAPMSRGSTGSPAVLGGAMFKFFRQQLDRLKSGGLEAERQTLAELGLRMAEQVRISESPSMMTDLVAYSQKQFFLKQLDPGTEITNTGRTAAEELAFLQSQDGERKSFLSKANAAAEFLQSAPMDVQSRYSDIRLMNGELAAQRYLVGELDKSKEP